MRANEFFFYKNSRYDSVIWKEKRAKPLLKTNDDTICYIINNIIWHVFIYIIIIVIKKITLEACS